MRSDVDKVLVGMKRARGEGEKRRLRNELKDLRKELRERERKAMRDILQVTTKAVLFTLNRSYLLIGDQQLTSLDHLYPIKKF